MSRYIRWFEEISIKDIPSVGGKNASLGEMYQALASKGVKIPPGFAVTADAFTEYLEKNGLVDKVYDLLSTLDTKNTEQLAQVGHQIRSLLYQAQIPKLIASEIREAYSLLCQQAGQKELDVAVRSSATAEDLPDASFAGQQETFLNIRGEVDLILACQKCFASLFTDRAISYRTNKGFDHRKVKLSIGIQQMVRSDLASSGVIFTLDPESGARNVILVTSSYGLGENIVGGRVDPDEFLVHKQLLGKAPLPLLRRKLGKKQQRLIYSGHGSRTTRNVEVSKADQQKLSISDHEVLQLATWASIIENHYSERNQRETPMDLEWAKDGVTGKLYILQARPETVHSITKGFESSNFVLKKKSNLLAKGRAVGMKIGAGKAKIIQDVSELSKFKEGEVLVADMTDPDWEPVMKKSSAIVTNRGGRTCHAAIVSREHGVPCIVGTGTATESIRAGQEITVSCAEGDEGFVYDGLLPFEETKISWQMLKKPNTKIMVNVGNPAQALKISLLPVDGVGLARMEFVISESVRIHPMALVHFNSIQDSSVKEEISQLLGAYQTNPSQYFVDKLAEGIGLIAGAFYPRPVIVRFSDFKTNEYAGLLGGKFFEPAEENPMIGFRGASRYYDSRYQEGFALECKAIQHLREEVGLKNIKVMIPFCRSPEEAAKVLKVMKQYGLDKKTGGPEVYVMSELPANILRAREFAAIVDGFSIGSNDLTQMILGVDRDSSTVSHLFDERDSAVRKMLQMAIQEALATGKPIGICGQAPSDFPEITKFLVQAGITSISVTPDSVLKTIQTVLSAESLLESEESLELA